MSTLSASKTVVWHLGGELWALYTGNPAVAEAAERSGLSTMAEYYNLREEGKPVAWQFVGPKEKVLAVVGGAAPSATEGGGEGGEGSSVPEGAWIRTPKRRRGQGKGAGAPQQLRLF